jgi:uncharacterized membrane protein YbhN (UPF0104 family)
MTSPPASAEYTAKSAHKTSKRGITTRPWWPWAKTIAKIAFFALVTWLLVTQARSIEWAEVLQTIRARSPQSLLIAALLAIGSYAIYGSYDLMGQRLTGHKLGRGKVVAVNLICYAFNLNLGATVGGAAIRFRLYSRLGLEAGVIARVIVFSMLTNWLGYLLLAGAVFAFRPLALPPEWGITAIGLHIFGYVMLALTAAYLALCAFFHDRSWTIKGHELNVPSLRMALLQLTLSSVNWLMIAGILFSLLEMKIPFTDVLCVLLIAGVAGVITHVPGGLGVIEAVFVGLLSHRLATNELLAAVLMYRTIYYLIPLAAATVGYLALEAGARKSA